MNVICPVTIPCPGSDSPILNVSSEAPDIFYWWNYTYPIPDQPNCLHCNPPTFTAPDCFGVMYSADSQQAADLMAKQASVNCAHDDNTCVNEPQTATAQCADGTPVSYTTPAGTFSAPVVGDVGACLAAANAQALAYAQQQASLLAQTQCHEEHLGTVCLSDLSLPDCSTDGSLSFGVSATLNGAAANFTWSISSGAVPTGMTLQAGLGGASTTISGTPTTAGIYHFRVKAVSANGSTGQRDYTVEVLSPATQNSAYSVTLTDPTCAPLAHDAALTGHLPTGLNWTEDIHTGFDVISGTPTTEQTCAFTLTYTHTTSGPLTVTVASLTATLVTFSCVNMVTGLNYQISAKFTEIGLSGVWDAMWPPFTATSTNMMVTFLIESGVTSIFNPTIVQV